MLTYKVEYFPTEERNRTVQDLKQELLNLGAKEAKKDEEADYIFIIGGDGTFFYFCKKYAFQNKHLIGIQSGKTAFSLNFKSWEIEKNLFRKWKELHLLKINGKDFENYAVNDIYITGNSFFEANIYINDFFLEKFRGSGLILSTQYGSTGMNKSMGGPILMVSKDFWILNEVGTCNTRNNTSLTCPIVLSSKNKLKIEILNSSKNKIYIDGIESNNDTPILTLEVSLIKGEAKVLEMKLEKYINRIREIFLV